MHGKMRRTQVAIDCLTGLASDGMVDHSTGGCASRVRCPELFRLATHSSAVFRSRTITRDGTYAATETKGKTQVATDCLTELASDGMVDHSSGLCLPSEMSRALSSRHTFIGCF